MANVLGIIQQSVHKYSLNYTVLDVDWESWLIFKIKYSFKVMVKVWYVKW